jgi:peptidoglycan/xylan/chitin deacetylase (PgdA/CDA1 family)
MGKLDPDTLPWQWSEAEWRSIIHRVRAGRRLSPQTWKNNARCAIALSFDSDHDTNELRDGGKSISRLSWGQYGSRVGVPRILDTLRKQDVRATFFVPGVTALLYPDEQCEIIAAGHEIGLHGWIHEVSSSLPSGKERELLFRATDTLERITGVRPVGARMPSMDVSQYTLLIQQELGLLYDSSLMADEDCYELLLDGINSGLIEVPVDWLRDDGSYFWIERFQPLRPYTAPADVFDIFRRELDAAFDAGGLFQLVLHPHVISYRSRIWILEELIRHARSRGDVWFATHAEVASWVKLHGARPR